MFSYFMSGLLDMFRAAREMVESRRIHQKRHVVVGCALQK